MLIQFSFENYRSFRDSATLSMLASSGKENPENVFETSAGKLLKSVAVFGSNASGKSNLIKALAAAIMIVRTTSVRQLDEPIPFVDRFLFDPEGKKDTSFEFDFIANGKRYIYGFSCDGNTISEEHLLAYKTQKPTTIFKRIEESYQFTDSKYKQELAVLVPRNTPNKLFLATATTWNATATREAFLWFSRFIDVYEPSNPIPMFNSYESDKDGGLKEFTKRLLKESDINITDYSIES
ncbi:MAG: AAA family ATPase, partial [Sphaerochaeta associata]|uniref:AAA family ATPase n=1 Tax=Sphaerochaeta associata TaxID=1129264 RepID=UPI002B20A789